MFLQRLYKGWTVSGNEAADSKAQFKLHSIRVSPETNVGSGYLWHYGHFIHDLIMPLVDWLEETGEDP